MEVGDDIHQQQFQISLKFVCEDGDDIPCPRLRTSSSGTIGGVATIGGGGGGSGGGLIITGDA